MKIFWMAPLAALFVLSGCGSSDASLSSTQEKAARDAFHAKPDINSLSPGLRKMVEAKMAAAKNRPTAAGTAPANP